MSDLKQQVVDLEQNQKLLLDNQLLQEKMHGLIVENREWRQHLGMEALVTEEAAKAKLIPSIWCLTSLTRQMRVEVSCGGVESKHQLPSQYDILLGILDNLPPVVFFKCPSPESASLEQLPEVYSEGPNS